MPASMARMVGGSISWSLVYLPFEEGYELAPAEQRMPSEQDLQTEMSGDDATRPLDQSERSPSRVRQT